MARFCGKKLSNHFKETKSFMHFKNNFQEWTGSSCAC